MIDPKPTVDEIKGIIARNEAIRKKWSTPGYIRTLDIELHALRLLLATLQTPATTGLGTLPIGGSSGRSSIGGT